MFREGKFLPPRGTYFLIGDDGHFLHATGTSLLSGPTPAHMPEQWRLLKRHGGTSPEDLLREVLDLTKMNVNNCSFADGTPITLSFADEVGEIMRHTPEGEEIQTGYKFYM